MDFPSKKPQSQNSDLFDIDPRRIISRALNYWYIIVLSLLVGGCIAFVVNRYSAKIYSVEASIIIKEPEEVSGGELIYNNPLIKFYRNYQNELYIIKSTPIIGKTVADLGFDKVFYTHGDIKVSETYKNLPLNVNIKKNKHNRPFEFTFQLLNEDTFELTYLTHENEVRVRKKFGETIIYDSIEFEVIKTTDVKDLILNNSRFKFSLLKFQDVVASYGNRLKVEWAEERSGVINLSLKGSITQKELDFLTTLIANYQQYDLENKNVAASNAIRFIDEQLVSISDSLNKAQSRLAAFKNRNVVTDLNSEAIRLYEKLEGLELQKTDLSVRERYYDYLLQYVKRDSELDGVILPSSIGINDPILSGLISEMMKLQTEVKLVRRHDKLENPVLTEKIRRMEELKGNIVESVKNQKSVDKIKIDFLNKGIREIESQLHYLPVAERQLVDIERNYALLDNLYNFLLQKRAEAGITKATNVSDVVVVNPPAVVTLVSPIAFRNYVLGLALGGGLPFVVIVLLELLNTRVQSREDIEKITSIPFIGGVGHKRMHQNLDVLQRPKSALSESFRALRSSLFYFLEGRQKGMFLITSSISGEGKTFTSINLASVFSMSGKRTLIVGADMRRPKIFPDFELDNDIGLSSLLAGMATFDQVVRATKFEGLYVVSGGPVPPNPSELILNDRMKAFLDEARDRFDFVFIDSPPLALVTDAFALSNMVDHTLFIVRQNYTPKPLLNTIDEFYKSGKIKRISIVLNDIYKSGPGYGYGYSYTYGNSYGYGVNKKQIGGYYVE